MQERSELERFFSPGTLERARVKIVPTIQNPDFFSMLRARGIPEPFDFRAFSGITFIDTILLSQSQMPPQSLLASLLFHELVHVVQYEVLGLEEFIEQYVRGWARQGMRYESIPLEHDARDLQTRYEREPFAAFSVRANVRRVLERL